MSVFFPFFLNPCVHRITLPRKGKFVSESKFKSHPEQFIPHIRNPNPAALEALITKPEVEAALLRRVRAKARQYGQDVGTDGRPVSPPAKMNGNGLNGTNGSGSGEDGIGKIDVNFVVELYEDYIIPLTKEVEVGTFFKSFIFKMDIDERCTTSRWRTC